MCLNDPHKQTIAMFVFIKNLTSGSVVITVVQIIESFQSYKFFMQFKLIYLKKNLFINIIEDSISILSILIPILLVINFAV